MTDRNPTPPEIEEGGAWPPSGRALGLVLASLLACVLIGGALLAARADAAGRWFRHDRHGWHGHEPEHLREHAAHVSDWISRHVDASDEQRARLEAILADGFDELAALGEEHRSRHDELVALLGTARIDRDALDALRAREMERADLASRELVATLADAAEVLTPEQRAELIEAAEHFHH